MHARRLSAQMAPTPESSRIAEMTGEGGARDETEHSYTNDAMALR